MRDITERKQAELRLHESERRFATLYRVTPVGTCITRLADGLFLDMNAAFARITGHTCEDMLGRSSLDVNFRLDPEDRARLLWEVAKHGTVRDWEVGFRRKDGSIGHSLRSVARLTINGEDCVLTTLNDITERRRTEEDLASSRRRLEIMSRQLIAAQESERRHLARELHDEIGQALTGIKLNLKALQQPAQTQPMGPLVQDTIDVVDQTLQRVRGLALDLRPSMLDDIGLTATLRWCLDRQSQRAGFTPQFVADPFVSGASPEINTACFRIAQESLTNIARRRFPACMCWPTQRAAKPGCSARRPRVTPRCTTRKAGWRFAAASR